MTYVYIFFSWGGGIAYLDVLAVVPQVNSLRAGRVSILERGGSFVDPTVGLQDLASAVSPRTDMSSNSLH